MEKEQEKRCFIVTPIGSDTDPIRRHIEGIMEAAIRPALGEKYELVVAHKIYEPGSITKQVISEIYNAELVIANLTNRNPNVMYELAFRHSLGKPVIMIAESGTSLPSDIIMERTIFYQNDAQGILDLKKDLEKAESEIDFSKIGSPIYDVLHSIDRDINILQISQNDTQAGQEVLPYILEKLNKLEDVVLATRNNNMAFSDYYQGTFRCALLNMPESENERISFCNEMLRTVRDIPQIYVNDMMVNHSENEVTFTFQASKEFSRLYIRRLFDRALSRAGIETVGSPMLRIDQ